MSFAPTTSSVPATKKPKIDDENSGTLEYFPEVPKVEFKGADSTDPLSFRYYKADEIVMGKPMTQWLKFSICFWR